MPFLPAAVRRPTPWKNGGGSTVEIAVSPEGAGLERFDWRISMARIERDGPFSRFPGVDRVLAVVEGQLTLEIEGEAAVPLDATSPPFAFSGDVATLGRPVGGPVVDLNVMTRRPAFASFVTPLELSAPREISLSREAVLIVLEGAIDLKAYDGEERLGRHDAWRGTSGVWQVTPAPYAKALMVDLVMKQES